ncbi:hypothetical protein M409DRAFT_20977 [Zasmidium cellare ATCC 36951]|uniref:Uncharacterized protein n=1 Tax=Zasmidium cellare ATCC 36951 TaxID=1080233 RepID=A0A6A6CP95_ZASCE|nr:uncharacterized protein M409DRAFT_20977 [Zasmidium cellare ATCC 36951]KAF2168964.1 hypothetical protein M409DRAFT_20977 [Zasmidium cellare ATCC 36951]
MAPRRLHGPTKLIIDFDGTLTVNDTMAILGRLPNNPPISWRETSEAYMRDYQVFKDTPYPWKNYDEEEYSGWLASRKWVEQRSAQRVQDAGFFRGVTRQDVHGIVVAALDDGSLLLRDGWLDLFELFVTGQEEEQPTSASSISIISVNWSESFIRRALWQAAQRSSHAYKAAICHYIDRMEIYANEIEGLDTPEGSSGVVCRESGQDIRTSDDKLGYMPDTSSAPVDGSSSLIVYLGDSSTDFDCLLTAHVGVWVSDVSFEQHQQAFKETFKPFNGFVPEPLSNESITTDMICWSPDLHQVLNLLTKPR